MGTHQRSATIIGAGIIGVTSAYALAKAGWRVTIFDAHRDAGMGASKGNGRQLSYSHTDALASPNLLYSLPNLALGGDAGFRLRVKAQRGSLLWLASFLGQCNAVKFRENTMNSFVLAQESRRAMAALLARHDLQFDRRAAGKLVLYREPKAFSHAQRAMAMKQAMHSAELGGEIRSVAPEEAAQIEPALRGALAGGLTADLAGDLAGGLAGKMGEEAERFCGAIYAPGDETGDCAKFTRALLALIMREYGVTFWGGTRAVSIRGVGSEEAAARARSGASDSDSDSGKAAQIRLSDGTIWSSDLAVICGGYESRHLLRQCGHPQKILPAKGYSFIAPKGKMAPHCSITDSARRIVFTDLGEEVLVAGFADLGDDWTGETSGEGAGVGGGDWAGAGGEVGAGGDGDRGVQAGYRAERMEALLNAARTAFPQAADYDAAHDFWAGMRPLTPNSLPRTKLLEPHLAVNSGHGMLGWTLAMGSAERLAEAVDK